MMLPLQLRSQTLEAFFDAVESGDTRVVERALKAGMDPNSTDRSGQTALMIAARQGHEEIVRMLLARKADPTRRSAHGDDALMMASLAGEMRSVRLLVAAKAPLDNGRWTPLHYAAFGNQAEVARFLIASGANKNAIAPNGYSPIMLAARNGHVAVARTILFEDPDLGHRSPDGMTALKLARAQNLPELEQLLLRAGAVE